MPRNYTTKNPEKTRRKRQRAGKVTAANSNTKFVERPKRERAR